MRLKTGEDAISYGIALGRNLGFSAWQGAAQPRASKPQITPQASRVFNSSYEPPNRKNKVSSHTLCIFSLRRFE